MWRTNMTYQVRECGGARILGSSPSNGTNETWPKNTMKGADGESNIDSPCEAKAYLVTTISVQADEQRQ